MERRKSQWLKGLELLNLRDVDVSDKIRFLERYYGEPLPSKIIEYLTTYQPLDILNYSNYEDEVFFWEKGCLVFVGTNDLEKAIHLSNIYDIDEIISRLDTDENSSLGNFQKTVKVFPIASNMSPYGDIVVSLAENTKGKIYCLSDYQDSEIGAQTHIADSIDEFISKILILPKDEAMQRCYK